MLSWHNNLVLASKQQTQKSFRLNFVLLTGRDTWRFIVDSIQFIILLLGSKDNHPFPQLKLYDATSPSVVMSLLLVILMFTGADFL